MAGVTVEDTKLGRESVRMNFAWALAEIDKLKPGERYDMTLECKAGSLIFRYFRETPSERKGA